MSKLHLNLIHQNIPVIENYEVTRIISQNASPSMKGQSRSQFVPVESFKLQDRGFYTSQYKNTFLYPLD